MNQSIKALVLLASAAVNQKPIGQDKLINLDINELYRLAAMHQMTSVVAFALADANIKHSQFTKSAALEVIKIVKLDYERKAVMEALSAAKIWYMPLKGIILQDYYPDRAMRQMADNDILYDEARTDDVKAIMNSLGFTGPTAGYSYHDDYYKQPLCHFEMHKTLFSTLTPVHNYYKNIKEKLIGEGYEFHFSNEDNYIYMIAHDHKHYHWAGIGLRNLLDIYVYLKKFNDVLNWDYIETELEKIGYIDYEKQERDLAMKLYAPDGVEALTTEEETVLDYYITSGAYGTEQRKIENTVNTKGKIGYLKRRLFIPMIMIKKNYPFFYEHKLFLPLLPIYRLCRQWRKAKGEWNMLKSVKKP